MTGQALSSGYFPTTFKCCAKDAILEKVSMEDAANEVIRTPQEELDYNFKTAYVFWRKVADSGANSREVEMAWQLYCAARDMRLFNRDGFKSFKAY